MKKLLTVATRAGRLAVVQTGTVCDALKRFFPELEIVAKPIATSGDRDRRTTLWELKETGCFTSQLEDAVLGGEADFAVHSLKDLPAREREGLTVAAVLDRKFPEDCLVVRGRVDSLDELPKGAKIGTSSLRRLVQMKRLRPDVQCVPIRGNVPTRLGKLDNGDYDALVLARAGLERLDLAERISVVFDPTDFIPAPGQGALAAQVRVDDRETGEIISRINDGSANEATSAERAIFAALNCGCHAPAGAFAAVLGRELSVWAFLAEPDGAGFVKEKVCCDAAEFSAEGTARRILGACGGRNKDYSGA